MDAKPKDSQPQRKSFPPSFACPCCPIVCHTYPSAYEHRKKCISRRNQEKCCLCKLSEKKTVVNPPDHYNPAANDFWYICKSCYEWAVKRGIAL